MTIFEPQKPQNHDPWARGAGNWDGSVFGGFLCMKCAHFGVVVIWGGGFGSFWGVFGNFRGYFTPCF